MHEYFHQHSEQLFHCLIPLNPNGFRVSTAFIDDVEKYTENGHLRAEARWYELGVIYTCIRTVEGDMGDDWGFGLEDDKYVLDYIQQSVDKNHGSSNAMFCTNCGHKLNVGANCK